jgi:hypothetical protein
MLTETAAREIFGDEDPIGKILTLSNMFATNRQKVDMVVTNSLYSLISCPR